jgi:hypothetical protein
MHRRKQPQTQLAKLRVRSHQSPRLNDPENLCGHTEHLTEVKVDGCRDFPDVYGMEIALLVRSVISVSSVQEENAV